MIYSSELTMHTYNAIVDCYGCVVRLYFMTSAGAEILLALEQSLKR